MAIKRTTRVDSGFSMSSMTDIVFLLLIFFLVTSTLINPNALKLLLPKSTGQVSAKATVSVSIKHWQDTDTFSYHINGVRGDRRRPHRAAPAGGRPDILNICGRDRANQGGRAGDEHRKTQSL